MKRQLKGPAWRGMTLLTPVGENDGRLGLIRNGYVSPDGQAIRRWPGYKCVVDLESFGAWETPFAASLRNLIQHDVYMQLVRPHCFVQVRGRLLFLGESNWQRQIVRNAGGLPVRVASYNGALSQITLDVAPQAYNAGAGVGVGTDGFGSAGDFIYIEGTGNVTLDGRFWRISTIVGTVITLTTAFVGAGVVPGPNLSAVWRVRQATAGGRTTIADRDGFALWTVRDRPNVTAPLMACQPSVIASRNWDYGPDATSGVGFTEGAAGVPRRKSVTPAWRANPEVAGARAIFAVPGLGSVLQAPLLSVPGGDWLQPDDLPNGTHDQLRTLGVPKAWLLDPGSKTVANGFLVTAVAPAQPLPRVGAGVYRFRVAYHDESTGEVGLPSEEVSYTVTGTEFPRLWVAHPAYTLGESNALTIVVYMSLEDSQALGEWRRFQVPINGQPPRGNAQLCSAGQYQDVYFPIDVQIPNTYGRNLTAVDINTSRIPDPIPQMPMGSSCARVVRGSAIFAGHVGDHGEELHLEFGTASARFELPDNTADRNGRGRDELIERNLGVDALALDGGFGVGAGVIPPAYAGQGLCSIEGLLADRRQVDLDRMINPYAFTDAGALQTPWLMMQRWRVRENVFRDAVDVTGQEVHLRLPRGLYQWSELGRPGVTPAINIDYLDADGPHEEVEALGRFGNSLVLATRNQAHLLTWSRSPSGNHPVLVSTQYGCIAPNTMVEFDGGIAWLSDRGPVAMRGGAPAPIGQDVSPWFTGRTSRYRRDNSGRMPFAWGCHDPVRRLVIFGLIANPTHLLQVENTQAGLPPTTVTFATASDPQRSKFPCDELLVWSYVTGAWSVVQPHQAIFWMSEVICSDGQSRIAYWAADRRLYALDDAWGAGGDRYGEVASETTVLDSTTFTGPAASFAATPGNQFVQPGMEFLIYRPTEPQRIIGSGTIVARLSDTQVQLSVPLSWQFGDRIVWGWQTLEVQSLDQAAAELQDSLDIHGVWARLALHTPATATGAYPGGQQGVESRAWCRLEVLSEDGSHVLDNQEVDRRGRVVWQADRLVRPGETTERAQIHEVAAGREIADHGRIVVKFRGPAQVRLHQIETSEEPT